MRRIADGDAQQSTEVRGQRVLPEPHSSPSAAAVLTVGGTGSRAILEETLDQLEDELRRKWYQFDGGVLLQLLRCCDRQRNSNASNVTSSLQQWVRGRRVEIYANMHVSDEPSCYDVQGRRGAAPKKR